MKKLLIPLAILLIIPLLIIIGCFLFWKLLVLISKMIRPILGLCLAGLSAVIFCFIPWQKVNNFIQQDIWNNSDQIATSLIQGNHIAAIGLWTLTVFVGIFLLLSIPILTFWATSKKS